MFLTSSFILSRASFSRNRSHRRLRAGCAHARFDWARPKPGCVSRLPAPLRPGSTKQMAPHQRQCAHNRRRNRAVQKRRPCGAHTFAAPATNRDDDRSRHCYCAPSRSSPLAHAIAGREHTIGRFFATDKSESGTQEAVVSAVLSGVFHIR